MSKRLNSSFYASTDVVALARLLIGHVLVSEMDGQYTSGIIVETEAYKAPEDSASHAYGNKKTKRTEIMYAEGGTAYIYICYGMHHLFNVITGPKDVPHAILIRALQPLEGIDIMQRRRNMEQFKTNITRGPGALSVAMGFHARYTGSSLISRDALFYIEKRNDPDMESLIKQSPRIGVENSGLSKNWPWRFYVRNNPFVSAYRS